MTERPDFNDPSLPTIVVGHPAIVNFRGEEVVVPEGLLERALEELGQLEVRLAAEEEISFDAGERFLRQVYAVVDRVGEAVSPGMSCQSGCSACCRVMVATTAAEAALIGRRMERALERERSDWKHEIVNRNELLDRLAERSYPSSDLTTFGGLLETCEMYERENRPCPSLGSDRLCQIYEDRPLLCRVCWVLTDPADCSPGQGPPIKFRSRVFEKAHALCGEISRIHFRDVRVSPIPYWFRNDG